MKQHAAPITAAILLAFGLGRADAASLQVTPVRLQIDAPAAASKVIVSSSGEQALTAQFRVFKWTRVDGKDELIQTRDVVASPPVVKLERGQPYVVRIVRVSKAKVAGEEAFRLLVDEIPDPKLGAPAFGPRFVVRQSIPVFITSPEAQPRIAWEAVVKKGRLQLVARNLGERRVKLSELSVSTGSSKPLAVDMGLGYVLGQSTERWSVKLPGKGIATGTTITILAQGDNGPIRTQAKVRAAQ